MAKICSVSSPLLIKRPFTIKTRTNKVVVKMEMVNHNEASFSKSSSQVQIRTFPWCSTRKKIFEDESQGIVCYKDEVTGETICEGYDEGPCLCPSVANSLPRDVVKCDVKKKKKKMLIQLLVNGTELDHTILNWMDFNSCP